MRSGTWLLALLFLGGLALALWFTSQDGGQTPDDAGLRPGAAPVEAGAPDEAPVELVAAQPDEEPARDAVEAPATSDEHGPAPAAAEAPMATVRGRCVDEAGRPLDAVRVQVGGPAAASTTGSDGVFELELLIPQGDFPFPMRLSILGDGLAREERVVKLGDQLPGAVLDLGDILLLPGTSLSGRVVDASGAPVAGANVRLQKAEETRRGSKNHGPYSGHDLSSTNSDAEGRFRLDNVRAIPLVVWAGGAGFQWATSEPLDLRPGIEFSDVVLVVEPLPEDAQISLSVVDPQGVPVPRAQLQMHYKLGGSSGTSGASCDEDGRYVITLGNKAPHTILASDPEGRFRPALADEVPPGTHDLVLTLGEPKWLTLTVQDEGGQPVEPFEVRFELDGRRVGYPPTDSSSEDSRVARPHENPGTIDLQLPPAEFRLFVEAEGFQIASSEVLDPELVELERTVVLQDLPGIRGIVTVDGEPAPNASVTLVEAIGEDQRYEVNDFPAWAKKSSDSETETDDQGRYTLTLREAGSWYVRAELEGYAPRELGPLELDPVNGLRDADLELTPGGSLLVRVTTPADESLGDVIVGFSRGDGHGFTERPGPDGEILATGLTPGSWQVVERIDEVAAFGTSTSMSTGNGPRTWLWNCEVVEGRETVFDLDLRNRPSARVEGRILLDGEAPLGWGVSVSGSESQGDQDVDASVSSSGRFALDVPWTGEARLALLGPLGEHSLYMAQELVLVEGKNPPIDVDLACGTVEGTLSDSAERRSATLYATEDGWSRWLSFEAAGDGSYRLPRVPAGEYQLFSSGLEASTFVNVLAGQTTQVSPR